MRQSILLLFLLFSFIFSTAQQKCIYLKKIKNLGSLSKEYFEKGDSYFLVIDAYKAGIIKDGEEYVIDYTNNLLLANGKSFPEPLLSEEKERLATLAKKYKKVFQTISFKPETDSTKAVHVYTVRETKDEADVNKNEFFASWSSYLDKQKELVRLLVAEKIIIKPSNLHISYNQNIVLINGKQIDNKLVKRYLPIFTIINNIPVPENKNEFTGFDIGKGLVVEAMK